MNKDIKLEKLCPKCGVTKSINDFYKRRGNKLASYCKRCTNIAVLKTRKQVKIMSIRYKGGSCGRCGYNKCIAAMEFHHIDPSQKDFIISNHYSWAADRIKKELDKCILLCSNCHREVHEEIVIAERDVDASFYDEIVSQAKWPKSNSNQPEWPKSKPKPQKNRCKLCDTVISNNAQLCLKCNQKKQEKIKWPSDEELSKLVWELPRTKLAKQLGVSDRAIAKRCTKKGISQPARGYWVKKKFGKV